MTGTSLYKELLIIVFLCLLFGCGPDHRQFPPVAQHTSGGGPGTYVIQPGDILDIKFFYNQELNETVTVRPDGMISLQLVDEIQAAGLHPSELDDILTQGYSLELREPAITVIVRSSEGRRVYIGGEVNRQGLIPLVGNVTPLQAVLSSGGFKESAAPEAALVIRKGPQNRPIHMAMDLRAELAGPTAAPSYFLQPNDIVYVPKSTIARANTFVNQYIEQLLLFRGINLGFSYQTNYNKD